MSDSDFRVNKYITQTASSAGCETAKITELSEMESSEEEKYKHKTETTKQAF